MPLAFTRKVSPRIAECALTHLDRSPIDAALAARQHAAYEDAIRHAGFEVIRLPDLPADPDAVFVEDTAILLGGHAIITRPGAASRRDEVHSTAEGLEPYFTVHRIGSGFVDGGDVLRVGSRLFVGMSNRTDRQGARALAEIAAPLGFDVVPVELGRCLHLKTAVTLAGEEAGGRPLLVANPDWVDASQFGDAALLQVHPDEPSAANLVRAGSSLIMARGSPRTASALRELGFTLVEVDLSELQKAEAGGTCMSLLAD